MRHTTAEAGIESRVRRIAAQASFLWERIDNPRLVPEPAPGDAADIERRIERWCTVLGPGAMDSLKKRLSWDGLDPATVRPFLGGMRLGADAALPGWAHMLREAAQSAGAAVSDPLPCTDPDEPLPFEDLLVPWLRVARRSLFAGCRVWAPGERGMPLGLLQPRAYHALERALLRRLSQLFAETLFHEFTRRLSYGTQLLNQLGAKPADASGDERYRQFVEEQLADGLLGLFDRYPVLGRLAATAVESWVQATAEFLNRLRRDRARLGRMFGAGTPPGLVSDIETGMSDPHRGGRSVLVVCFESGLELVYKPRGLGLELAFNRLLAWCNSRSGLPRLRVFGVLDCGDYGWVERVAHAPCAGEGAAARFYRRAGMLLCLLDTLRCTDCHNENLIASGEHLVLVDVETLLHHEARPMEDSPAFDWITGSAAERLWNSALRTGLLPRWQFSTDRSLAYDVSGLGGTEAHQVRGQRLQWQQVNGDGMRRAWVQDEEPARRNVPVQDGKPLSPGEHEAEIAQGYEETYRFLMRQREALLAPRGPLAALRGQKVRFVFRPTRVYGVIREGGWQPRHLADGADFSIELERLAVAFLAAKQRPQAWPILHAELRDLERLDIPLFTASTADDAIELGAGRRLEGYFRNPSHDDALARIRALSEDDLALQLQIIRGSLHARTARTAAPRGSLGSEKQSSQRPGRLLDEARAVALELEVRAIHEAAGGVNWLGLALVHEAECYQLDMLGDSLYEGRCGVALFLGAACQVLGAPHFGELALHAVRPLRERLRTLDPQPREPWGRHTGIGGAAGLGSMIYALTRLAGFIDQPALLHDARQLAELIAPELVSADETLDVIGGSAGAILGLLALHRELPDAALLQRADACGRHLLDRRESQDGRPRAWPNPTGRHPLAGFSHGAAGIAYALARLFTAGGDEAYRAAALEGIEYERGLFNTAESNWPDLRQSDADGRPGFPVQWCHGAAGIALARLGCRDALPGAGLEGEIEAALATTRRFGLGELDHVCCGNLSRVETLLVASRQLGRPELGREALEGAGKVLARARRNGAYTLFSNLPCSVYNPGFFQGTSGIGYELLRLARPELPCILLWE